MMRLLEAMMEVWAEVKVKVNNTYRSSNKRKKTVPCGYKNGGLVQLRVASFEVSDQFYYEESWLMIESISSTICLDIYKVLKVRVEDPRVTNAAVSKGRPSESY